jgi:hypothetical protein
MGNKIVLKGLNEKFQSENFALIPNTTSEIRLSFELTILGFSKTHVLAHLPNYVEFLNIKLKK